MKIKSIQAFAIANPIAGGVYETERGDGVPRRPAWTKDAEVANPMSRYPKYKALRSSWNGKVLERNATKIPTRCGSIGELFSS
jgi:L-rhamnonate dehydratase